MLILTRKVDETITIGDVTIMVTRIMPGSVRIGVQAPQGTAILRGELAPKPKTSVKEEADIEDRGSGAK